jgi:hypothetical protein
MPNARILNDNAALRATLTASSVRSGTSVGYLAMPRKGDFWGSTANTATIIATFAQAETIGMAGLFFTNLSAASTMRMICCSDTLGNVVVNNTGYLSCTPAPAVDYTSWQSVPAGANGFAYGSGADAVVYAGGGQVAGVRRVQIDITHTQPIEAAFLVLGRYLELAYNPNDGVQLGHVSLSKMDRSSAGDPVIDRGPLHKVIKMEFDCDGVERKKWFDILRKTSLDFPVFISLSPESTDKTEEHHLHIYGHLSELDLQKLVRFNGNVHSLSLYSV